MKDLLQRLGQRIRELRSQRGWSQEEFAAVCRVHRTYVGHLERGEKNLSLGTILRVAGALNVSLLQLFDGVEVREISGAMETPKNDQRRSKVSDGAGLDRAVLLAALTSLERDIRRLKILAAPRGKQAPTTKKKSQRKVLRAPPG